MPRVLLIEAFYGGSHKQLADLLVSELGLDVMLCTLPAKKWHWRARTAALYFSQMVPRDGEYRVLFTSSVLALAELVALRPDLAGLRKVLYFHENQLLYPVRKQQQRDFQYGYNQILASMVADEVLFNSQFNMDSFLSHIPGFLRQMPDHRPTGLPELIRPKCRVLHFPLVTPQVNAKTQDILQSSDEKGPACPHQDPQSISTNKHNIQNQSQEAVKKVLSHGEDKNLAYAHQGVAQNCISVNPVTANGTACMSVMGRDGENALNPSPSCAVIECTDPKPSCVQEEQSPACVHNMPSASGQDTAPSRKDDTLFVSDTKSNSTLNLIKTEDLAMESEAFKTQTDQDGSESHDEDMILAVESARSHGKGDCMISSDHNLQRACVNSSGDSKAHIMDICSDSQSNINSLNSIVQETAMNVPTEGRISDDDSMQENKRARTDVLHIVWPHRWEHDKDPEMFFRTLLQLKAEGLSFRVSVLGEMFTDVPAVFSESRALLSDQISHWGFLPSKSDYYRVLRDADVAVSTAKHEFYGVAMLEAAQLGCFPLCPKKLVYPEIFPHAQCLYNTENQLLKKLRTFCKKPHLVRNKSLELDLDRFSWDTLKPKFAEVLTAEGNQFNMT